MAFLDRLLDTPIEKFLPDDLRVAMEPLEKNDDAFSDSIGERVPWAENRHAIYLGKWPRIGKKPDSIYTDDAVLALVDHAHAQNPDGRVQIVLGPQLSEWFNGEPLGDGTDYLSPEEQKAHLEVLIRQELSLATDQFQIVFWKDEPAHRGLFERIETLDQSPSTPAGPITPEILFEGFEPGVLNPAAADFSLQVAFLLWQRTQADSAFQTKILDTVPEHFCSAEDGGASHRAYGLSEIALRLADLVQGRPIQLGVDGQWVYDKVILQLLNEANPGVKQVPTHAILNDLYPLLQGKVLRPIRLNTKQPNFFALRKVQQGTRERLALDAARLTFGLGVLSCVSVSAYESYQAEKAAELEAQIQSHLVACAADLDFGAVDSTKALKELSDQMLQEVERVYGVEQSPMIQARAVDFLCSETKENDLNLLTISKSQWATMALVDDFVEANKIFLVLRGDLKD